MRNAFFAVLAACAPSSSQSHCKAALHAGDVVITEVFAEARAVGASTGKQWLEIYNRADRALDLDGVVLVRSRLDGSGTKSHAIAHATIAPGAYFVLGDALADQRPPYVDYGYGAELGSLEHGGKLELRCNGVEIAGRVPRPTRPSSTARATARPASRAIASRSRRRNASTTASRATSSSPSPAISRSPR
jgi:hypothetical protein